MSRDDVVNRLLLSRAGVSAPESLLADAADAHEPVALMVRMLELIHPVVRGRRRHRLGSWLTRHSGKYCHCLRDSGLGVVVRHTYILSLGVVSVNHLFAGS